jgi:hypothetical protein
LVNRGNRYGELGDSKKAIVDYSTVVEMAGASVEQKADAMNLRGVRNRRLRQFEQSVNDFTTVADMPGVSPYIRTYALFCLPEVMIPIRPLDESVASIQNAFEKGYPEANSYGGSPGDIIRMVLLREHHAWPKFIERFIPIYEKFGALNSLGSGLMKSIAFLDVEGHSKQQLDFWISSWKKFGVTHDELSISLSALNAAVQVITTGNDKPLFDLPLEIRRIVRPLLRTS